MENILRYVCKTKINLHLLKHESFFCENFLPAKNYLNRSDFLESQDLFTLTLK
jgi:hypothetical protein